MVMITINFGDGQARLHFIRVEYFRIEKMDDVSFFYGNFFHFMKIERYVFFMFNFKNFFTWQLPNN